MNSTNTNASTSTSTVEELAAVALELGELAEDFTRLESSLVEAEGSQSTIQDAVAELENELANASAHRQDLAKTVADLRVRLTAAVRKLGQPAKPQTQTWTLSLSLTTGGDLIATVAEPQGTGGPVPLLPVGEQRRQRDGDCNFYG